MSMGTVCSLKKRLGRTRYARPRDVCVFGFCRTNRDASRIYLQRSFMRHTAILAILFLLAMQPFIAQSLDQTGGTKIPLHPYAGKLRTVETVVGGKRRSFLFDTGGGMTLITPEVAKEIGCTPTGRLTAFRMDGTQIHFLRCGLMDFNFSGVRVSVETAVFDLMALLPKDFPPLAGIISLHTFQAQPFTVNLGENELILESPNSLKTRIKSMKLLQMRIGHQAAGATVDAFVATKIGQDIAWFEIDSGNLDPVLIAPHLAEKLSISETGVQNLSFEIFGLPPLDEPALRKDLIYDGVLNAHLLERLALTFDIPNNRLWGKVR